MAQPQASHVVGRALFSTQDGQRPPRPRDPVMSVVIRSDPNEDCETMAARLQARFPALCKNITAFGLEVGEYFDDYDQQLQGRVFLQAVLLHIAQDNAIRAREVQDLAGRWLATNSEAFKMLGPAHGIEQIFTQDDIDQHDMQLLEEALGLIQSAARAQFAATSQEEDRLPEQHRSKTHEERELILSHTANFTTFPAVLPEGRVISNPEQSQTRPQPQLYQREGPVRQIPPAANGFLSQQARYPQQRFTPSTELLEHIHPGATNRGDFHSDPTAGFVDPPTMDPLTAIPSRGVPGPFGYVSLPHVPLTDRLRNFNPSIPPRGKKNPTKRSSDDARKASYGANKHRQSSNHGSLTNFGVPIPVESPRSSASMMYEHRLPTMQTVPIFPRAVQMSQFNHYAKAQSTYSEVAKWTGAGPHLQSRPPNADHQQPQAPQGSRSIASRTPKGMKDEQPRRHRVWIGNIPADFGKSVILEMLSPCRGLQDISEPKATDFRGKTLLMVFASFNTKDEAEEALDRLPQTKFECLSEGHFLRTGWPREPDSAQRKPPKAHNVTVDHTPCPSPPGKGKKGGHKYKSSGPMASESAKTAATTVEKPTAIASDKQQQAPKGGAKAGTIVDGAESLDLSTAPTSYLQTERSNSLIDGLLTIPSEPSPSTWTDGAGIDPELLRMRLQADIKDTDTVKHQVKPSENIDLDSSEASAPHLADVSNHASLACPSTLQQDSIDPIAHDEGKPAVVTPYPNQQIEHRVDEILPSTSSPDVKSAASQAPKRKQKSSVPTRSSSPPPRSSALPPDPSPIQTRKKKAKPQKPDSGLLSKKKDQLSKTKKLEETPDTPSLAVESALHTNLPKPETPFQLDGEAKVTDLANRPQFGGQRRKSSAGKGHAAPPQAKKDSTLSQDLQEAMVEAGYCSSLAPSAASRFPVADPVWARLEGMFEQEAKEVATQDDKIHFRENGKSYVMNRADMTEAIEGKALLERAAAAKRLAAGASVESKASLERAAALESPEEGLSMEEMALLERAVARKRPEEGSSPRTPTKNDNAKGDAAEGCSAVEALCARIGMIGLQNVYVKTTRLERNNGDLFEDRRAKEAVHLVNKSPKQDLSKKHSKEWHKTAKQYINSNTLPEDAPIPFTPTRSGKAEARQSESPLVLSEPGSKTAVIRLKPGEDARQVAAGHLADPNILFGTNRDELTSLEDLKTAFNKPGDAMTPLPSQSNSQDTSSEASQNVVGSWNQNSGFKQSDVQDDVQEENGGESSSVSRGGYAEAVRKSLDEKREGEEKGEKEEAGKSNGRKSVKQDPWASEDVWGLSKGEGKRKR